MAQTFSLWGKKMFLTAVIVFIAFSSFFFFFPCATLLPEERFIEKTRHLATQLCRFVKFFWQVPYVLTALSMLLIYLFA